jgi:putative membrane protein
MLSGQFAYLVNFLLYLIVAIPLLGLGMYLFTRITPYPEAQLLKEGAAGNSPEEIAASKAAAFDLGGKVLGMSVVLASAIYHSLGLLDLVIWGLVAIIFQIIVFYLFELFTPFKVLKEIPAGNVAIGIFSSFLSFSTGIIVASLISY